MSISMNRLFCLGCGLLFAAGALTAAEWRAPDFAATEVGKVPAGWRAYITGPDAATRAAGGEVGVVDLDGRKVLKLLDRSEACEYGISRTFAYEPGKHYRAILHSRAGSAWRNNGAVLSARFLPGGKVYRSKAVVRDGRTVLDLTDIPEGTREIRLSVFTHRKPTTELYVESIELLTQAVPFAAMKPFSVPGGQPDDRNVHSFAVKAPAPGVYRLYSHTAVPELGEPKTAEFRVGDGPPRQRRVVRGNVTRGRLEVDRLTLTGEPVSLTVTMPPGVTLEKLEFRPEQPVPVPPAAAAYQPKLLPPPRHPRVLVNPEALGQIRAHLEQGENRPVWERVKKLAVAPYPFAPPTDRELGFDGRLLGAVRAKAFYFLVAGDEAVGREAVELARRYLELVSFGNGQDITRRVGEAIFTGALVYDWCYTLMTPEDGASLRKSFLYHAAAMETGWPPFRQTITVGHGNEAQMCRDQLAMAIAVYDEDPAPWQYLSCAVFEQLEAAKRYLYRSGRHHQGTSYGNYRFSYDLYAAAHLLRTFGYELLDPEDTRRSLYYWIYLRTPDGLLLPEGDGYLTGRYPGGTSMNFLGAALYRDPLIKEEFLRLAPEPARSFDSVLFLLFNDPALAAADLRHELPLTKFFDAPLPGMAARTGWNRGAAADDVVVLVNGADTHFRNHQHLDGGAFQIYFRGRLAADLGEYRFYGTPYDWNFNKGSISHSVLRLIDPEQKNQAPGKQFTANYGGQELTGWGGPRTVAGLAADPDRYRSGLLLRRGAGPVEKTPLYSFLQTDLTPSYPGRATSYRRSAVFLNLGGTGTPAALVVHDQLKTAAARIQPVFQLTTLARPEPEGDGLAVRCVPYGRTGKLSLRTLLPEQSEYRIFSGAAAHRVAGTEFTPPFPERPEASGSRTEVWPAAGADGDTFLHLMQIQDGDAAPLPAAARRSDGRLELSFGSDWLLSFGTSEAVTSRSFEFRVDAAARRVLLLDLAPGLWTLQRAGRMQGAAEAGDGGELFLLLEPGLYRCAPGGEALPRLTPPPLTPPPVPPPPARAVYLDGRLLPGAAVREGLAPLDRLLAAQGRVFQADDRELRFSSGAQPVRFRDGAANFTVGTLELPLKVPVRRLDGTWYVEPVVAAGLLDCRASFDAESGSVLLLRKPPGPVLFASAMAEETAWQALVEEGSGSFIVAGRDQQAEFVLKEPRLLRGVALRYPHGGIRRAGVKIEVSSDGKAFATVFDGESSGLTADFEAFDFAPRPVRLVRFTFRGNRENHWTTLTGVRLLEAGE